jgi:hypothetical protein
MNTRIVDLRRCVAAASATLITAVGAWAFVSSTASIERDPFQFASVMAANAKVRIAQLHNRTASSCPNNPEARDHRDPVCVRG